ncbi:MAG: hypothetical protein ABW252_04785 [Polyangiales bacterium]
MPRERDDASARWLGVIGALLGLVAAGVFAWGGTDFCLDDAYIHLAYAKSLQRGEGFSYNPHDWELGATSPLWTLLLVPLADRPHTVVAVKTLGVLLHAACCGVLPALMRALAPVAAQTAHTAVLLVPTALFALHPLLLQGAGSGMEVPLATLLLEGVVLLALREKHGAAAALAWLAVWTRPEALLFAVLLALGLALAGARRALWIAATSVGALATWVAYCLVVAGQLVPNTFLAKLGQRDAARGLSYLVESVLADETWLVGVGGLVLAVLALRDETRARRAASLPLAIAWACTLLAIAVSRGLHPGVLFAMQRYFAVFAFAPPAIIGAALRTRRARDALWLGPAIALLLVRLPEAHATMRLQERGIAALHTNVALWVGEALSANSRVLAEGAGALRYFTPRSQVVLDFLGLNHGGFVHALRADANLHACLVWLSKPDVAVMPSELLGPMHALFRTETLRELDDPTYAQAEHRWHRQVRVLRILGPTTRLRDACAAIAARRRRLAPQNGMSSSE